MATNSDLDESAKPEFLPHRLSFDDQYLATIGRRSATRQVLLFMGIRACIEPFELRRAALLAEVWDAQVTVIDTPGYGYGGARLTTAARQALRHGSFVPAAVQMVSAAQRHHPILARASVNVVGYSMGASLAAAALATRQLDVDTLSLVEPVALRRWRVVRLLYSVRQEDSFNKQYLEENFRYPYAVLPATLQPAGRPPKSRIDLMHLGAGLARGRLRGDMLSENNIDRLSVHVVHGRDSTLSRSDDVERFVNECRSAGFAADNIPIDGRHALWHSLATVESLARLLLAQWTDQPRPKFSVDAALGRCLPPTACRPSPSESSI